MGGEAWALVDHADRINDKSREERDESFSEGLAEGVVEGRKAALLVVLASRGIEIDDRTLLCVGRCDDPLLLETWISRAALAKRVSDVFS